MNKEEFSAIIGALLNLRQALKRGRCDLGFGIQLTDDAIARMRATKETELQMVGTRPSQYALAGVPIIPDRWPRR